MVCKVELVLNESAVEEVNSIADPNQKAQVLHRVLTSCVNDLIPSLINKPLTRDSKFVKHIGITIQGETVNDD